MRLEVVSDERVAATAQVFRQGGRAHVAVVAMAHFAIVPDGVARYRGPATFVARGALAGAPRVEAFEAPRRPLCDVTLVGSARMIPGTLDAYVRLGLAAGGRVVLDKVVRVPGATPGSAVPLEALGPRPLRDGLAPRAADGVVDVPHGFDWSVFQTAPADQRIAFPVGGEWLVLDGIDAAAPRVTTQLPSRGAEARIRILGGAPSAAEATLSLACDTIAVDADRREITLAWRGSWPLPDDGPDTRCVLAVGLHADDARVDFDAVWRRAMPVAPRAATRVEDETLLGATAPMTAGAALPFAASAPPAVASALTGVAGAPAAAAPQAPVDDSTRPGVAAPAPWVAPFPMAAVAPPAAPRVLTGLPWGGPVKSAPEARPGDETVAVGPAPAPPTADATALAARLREMAKDPAEIRKLMESLRRGR